MAQWEYQIIEVIYGKVNQVNNKIINKTEGGLFKGVQMYTLDEYLSQIGHEGWEVIIYGDKNLLHSPERVNTEDIRVLIAKRPLPEQ